MILIKVAHIQDRATKQLVNNINGRAYLQFIKIIANSAAVNANLMGPVVYIGSNKLYDPAFLCLANN